MDKVVPGQMTRAEAHLNGEIYDYGQAYFINGVFVCNGRSKAKGCEGI